MQAVATTAGLIARGTVQQRGGTNKMQCFSFSMRIPLGCQTS